ncbi:stalk domain-containing protein [Paenibacillus humicola]|uniref:stalk domain-containing protein n=1 Tax=Paenibacillus humicola TaxID=3110540 RepID=UPI00237B95F7|nr:stalk domain-containing protein [Paenibacillus humicola]
MKFRKILILLLVMSLWGGTMIFADSAAQKIRVIVNGSTLDDSGLIVDGKTYLPIRQIADTLQSLIVWDDEGKTATLFKPNVHMFLFQDDKKIFGNVTAGSKITFNVFAQIDNLTTDISGVKVSLFDPSGTETIIQSENEKTEKDNFWYKTNDITYTFNSPGKYVIRFFMKINPNDDWRVVSEKTITSK